MAELVRVKFSQFFDRAPVMRAASKAARRVLSKAGAFVRTTARQSIKNAPFDERKPRGQARTNFRRSAISRPGQPPLSRVGTLKRMIFFGYEPERESVVIGPAAVFTGTRQTPKAPEALEFGGIVRRNGKTYRYRARPFMRPALEAEAPKFPGLFKDSVR